MSKKEDFRKLSKDAQASMRRVALKLIKRGEKQLSVADVIGVSRQTISEWVSKNRIGDKYAISGKPRGRKRGEHRLIKDEQAVEIQNHINNSKPEDHNIKSALWSRKSINALIKKYYPKLANAKKENRSCMHHTRASERSVGHYNLITFDML